MYDNYIGIIIMNLYEKDNILNKISHSYLLIRICTYDDPFKESKSDYYVVNVDENSETVKFSCELFEFKVLKNEIDTIENVLVSLYAVLKENAKNTSDCKINYINDGIVYKLKDSNNNERVFKMYKNDNANAVSLYEIDQATHKQKFLFTHKDDDSDILINLLKLNKIL